MAQVDKWRMFRFESAGIVVVYQEAPAFVCIVKQGKLAWLLPSQVHNELADWDRRFSTNLKQVYAVMDPIVLDEMVAQFARVLGIYSLVVEDKSKEKT